MITVDSAISPNFKEDSLQSSQEQSKEGVTGTPAGGDGNTPLMHRIDIAKRILSKHFVDVSFEVQNSCPINGVAIGLDYLQCTGLIPMDERPDKVIPKMLRLLKGFLSCGLTDSGESLKIGNVRTYKYKYTSVNGVVFAYGYFPEGLRYYLQFPGVPLRMLLPRQWKALIAALYFDFFAKFTRGDICIDDYKRRVTGQKLVQLAQRGDVARVSKYYYVESGFIGAPGETTVYFGSNRKQLYFYNALYMHGIHADRLEARLREDRAHEVLKHIAEFEYTIDESEREELTQDEITARMLRYMGSVCLGCVDFVHRSGRKRRALYEFPRYDFWQSLIDDVGGIQHISIPKPKLDVVKFVAKTVKWLDRSVFKKMALCSVGFGKELFDEYLAQEIKLGSIRFNDRDMEWIFMIKDLFGSVESDSDISKLEFINLLKST